MPAQSSLTDLTKYDTCVLADAIERLGGYMNNRGFTQPGLRRLTDGDEVLAGYAATARVRSANAPVLGHSYFRHSDWWEEIRKTRGPRLIAIEDVDDPPGRGACVGEVAAAAFCALGAKAAITNGAGREIPSLSRMGFSLFARYTLPSRAYAHLVDHSTEVNIFGLRIRPGDLLVADQHGVISVPEGREAEVSAMAAELSARKRVFVDFCRSGAFTIEAMEAQLRQLHW